MSPTQWVVDVWLAHMTALKSLWFSEASSQRILVAYKDNFSVSGNARCGNGGGGNVPVMACQ